MAHAESGRRFSERDLPLAEDLARRAGVAVYNAQLYGEAQAASRAKDEFLATLSHELRTPMTSILGWARMLDIDGGQEIRSEAIQAIKSSAEVQAQLIEDILDVSRITLGKLRLNVQNVEMVDVLRAAVDSVRPAANAKQIRLTAAIESDGMAVPGDGSRLHQVVWNLLSNAVKFTPRGGAVFLRAYRAHSEVVVEVRDSGEGIPPDFLPHIFERFSQADSTSTRRFGGLGIGLAIVKQLTEMHGGRVTAASDGVGRGATFTVAVPVSAGTLTLGEGIAVKGSDAASLEKELPELTGANVLIVDDDPGARRFVSAVLERAGARVEAVASAEEALAFLRQTTPEVLVSDIAMPDRDGFSLIEEIRHLLKIAPERMPAIALSAFGRNEDRVRILAAGFQSYLMKPVDPVELARAVAESRSRRTSEFR